MNLAQMDPSQTVRPPNSRALKGLFPICAWCKQVRNDQGHWEQIDQYLTSHTRAELTHSVCPECARRLKTEPTG